MKLNARKGNAALALAAVVCSLAMDAFSAKILTGETTTLFSNVAKDPEEVYELSNENIAATSNVIVTVEATVSFDALTDRAILQETNDMIGALAATTNTSGTAVWLASDGDGWVELSGHTPATNTAYVIKTELDLGAKKLRHYVKASGVAEFTALGGGSWLDASSGDSALSRIVAFGDFTSITFGGKCQASSEVDVSGAGNISFDPTALAALGVDTDGKTAEQIASSLEADGSNGIARWKNYVLGLSTTDPTAKPYVAPVQNADPAKLTFSLGGVSVNESSGATVKYAVGEVNSPLSDFTPSSWTDPEETIQLDVPSGVKYYRIKVQITTP